MMKKIGHVYPASGEDTSVSVDKFAGEICIDIGVGPSDHARYFKVSEMKELIALLQKAVEEFQ